MCMYVVLLPVKPRYVANDSSTDVTSRSAQDGAVEDTCRTVIAV